MILKKAYKKHKDWIAICISFGCNEDTCKDLVSEMYLKIDYLDKKGTDLSYGDSINYWYCYKILYHLFAMLKRKEKKQQIIDIDSIIQNDINYLENKLSTNSSVDYEEFDERFNKLLSDLNWYDRSIFELVSSGKKITEISKETNISYVSLWHTYKKIKLHIRNKIKNYDWFRGFSRDNN